MGTKANARKGQGKPGTRIKKDTESLLSLRFSERRDCIDYFNILGVFNLAKYVSL
jgi:hypothetical protein